MKRMLLRIAGALAKLWGLVPAKLRRKFLMGLFILEGRTGPPGQGLRRLFETMDDLDLAINERAMAYGEGVHPKHRLMAYHDFFVSHIPADSRVLDIGCGHGAVAASIADRVSGVSVTGIDFDTGKIAQAKAWFNRPNLEFVAGDALNDLADEAMDVVVLSNVLEHIDHRSAFLKRLLSRVRPSLVLIRVPAFERHWHLPMRRELGVNYFSDPTHFIEHRWDEFRAEMNAAGLRIEQEQQRWGEIWAVCRPATDDAEPRQAV